MLLLPENSSLVSDRNESSIGTLYGGASLTVSWEVVFTQNGTYDLNVITSELISGDQRREIIRTTAITIGGEEPVATCSSYLGFGFIIACVSLVSVGFFLVRRTNRKGSDSEQTQQEQH